MCNNNHDILILKRYVDRERDRMFKRLHKKLQELEAKKREYERRIHQSLHMLDKFPSFKQYAYISFLGVRRPHAIVEVATHLCGCKPTIGLGIARCWESKDEWDEEEGIRIATEKAVRHAARKLAGLE